MTVRAEQPFNSLFLCPVSVPWANGAKTFLLVLLDLWSELLTNHRPSTGPNALMSSWGDQPVLSAPTLKLSDHLGDNGCPACLVTGSHTSAGAAVEVFIKLKEISPSVVVLEQVHISIEGATT